MRPLACTAAFVYLCNSIAVIKKCGIQLGHLATSKISGRAGVRRDVTCRGRRQNGLMMIAVPIISVLQPTTTLLTPMYSPDSLEQIIRASSDVFTTACLNSTSSSY